MEIISRKEAKEQGLKYYFTGKPCKYGHVGYRQVTNSSCCECLQSQAGRARERYTNNGKVKVSVSWYSGFSYDFSAKHGFKCFDASIDAKGYNSRPCRICGCAIKATVRKRCISCTHKRGVDYILMRAKCRAKEISKLSAINNKMSVKARRDNWVLKNKDAIVCRNLLTRLITNWQGSRSDAERILGWKWEEFVCRMESMFLPGMSWSNNSMHGWHIDHIKPVSAFIKEGITDPAIINALDNLQPLWAKDNLSKGAKYDE